MAGAHAVEQSCDLNGSKEAKERKRVEVSFKGTLLMTLFLPLGPSSLRFHHLPLSPQARN
jgi:hypothetical protein